MEVSLGTLLTRLRDHLAQEPAACRPMFWTQQDAEDWRDAREKGRIQLLGQIESVLEGRAVLIAEGSPDDGGELIH